jgi:hypothetical protein
VTDPLPPWPDSRQITRPDAVELLTGNRSLRLLRPFMLGAHTLTSAARELDRPVTTLAYWIPRFVASDLLVQLDVVARAGTAMPRYRAAARQFTVPVGALPHDRRIALLDRGRLRLLDRFLDGVDEAVEREGGLSLGFAAGPDAGTMAIEMVEDDVQRAQRDYTDAWSVLRLDRADAQALARELEDVLARYSARRGRRRYVVHMGLAAEPHVEWRSLSRAT